MKIFQSVTGVVLLLGMVLLVPSNVFAGPKEIANELTRESLTLGTGIDFKSETAIDLGGAQKVEKININLPSAIENGNAVPVIVISNLSGTSFMELLSDRHTNPIASFSYGQIGMPYVSTRFRMGAPGTLYVRTKSASGDAYSSAIITGVAKHGQSNLSVCKTKQALLSAKETGRLVQVDVMIEHCMNLDKYVRKIALTKDGNKIVDIMLSAGISRNPFFRFIIKGNKKGVYELNWEDSSGSSASISRTY